MAWNPSPKVADCRIISRRWNKKQIIIIAINPIEGTLETVSYGETKELCAEAKKLAKVAHEAIMEAC